MRMHIDRVMSKNVITIGADESINRAAELMWNHDVGYLPVVDAEGRVIAAITDRDVCMAAFTQGKPLHAIPVRSAMSLTLAYVRPDAPLDVAEELMRQRQLNRLPVIDADDRAVGVVSLKDLARVSEQRGGPSAKEVVHVLGGIARPPSETMAAAE
jgi:CBS domain-containing protein